MAGFFDQDYLGSRTVYEQFGNLDDLELLSEILFGTFDTLMDPNQFSYEAHENVIGYKQFYERCERLRASTNKDCGDEKEAREQVERSAALALFKEKGFSVWAEVGVKVVASLLEECEKELLERDHEFQLFIRAFSKVQWRSA